MNIGRCVEPQQPLGDVGKGAVATFSQSQSEEESPRRVIASTQLKRPRKLLLCEYARRVFMVGFPASKT
eukprot:CAMPEP_0184746850 /NCGR_PEP_ID=MMETSP0315-20130426/9352_1 /TAXON_ID=101924 /ORGANISM="Rhodosorus marinus, Strain UTEX LB 2760" /LENGTH=68 /DNA_ID=CAMNT_0027219595 /DNA_START=18 /DNA_END=224 /DNA_ORIENTATION=-